MIEQTELTVAPKLVPMEQPAEPTLGQVLAGVTGRALTPESVAVAKEVMAMMERQESRQAEKSYVSAFSALQAKVGKVKATRIVPLKNGGEKFRYADYEEIYDELKPHLDANGFAWSIVDTVYESNRVFAVGQLRHVSGHKETFRYGVQIGSGPPGATTSQADGSAISYAKRGCLCNAFNIVVERAEDEARHVGDYITPEQAKALRKRVLDTGSDEKSFLAFARAEDYEHIGEADYPRLDAALRKKESTK